MKQTEKSIKIRNILLYLSNDQKLLDGMINTTNIKNNKKLVSMG